MMNPLYDKEFLLALDRDKNKEVFAKIIALDLQEHPIEEITGRVTGGSINIDGTSSVRRTCSVTMAAEDININEYYWGFKTKFSLSIGLTNHINNAYPDIIWFKQGIFVITTFNTSHNTNSYNINISGKDKMCLLNGELGGSFGSSIDFGQEEYLDLENNTVIYTKIPIKTILLNMINVYGNEPLSNISINDVEDYGVELMEYRGEKPLYLFRNANGVFDNLTPYNDTVYLDQACQQPITLENIAHYDPCIADLTAGGIASGSVEAGDVVYKKIGNNVTQYTIAKLNYGDTVGYRLTDLTYAGDLIANVGETVTSILDKIIQMLGNFEYYYDIDGVFVFREKRSYVNTSYNNLTSYEGETYAENANYSSSIVYNFTDSSLITSISNNPLLTNVKNDYIVWGNRKSIAGDVDIPIHMRVAIDVKPEVYTQITVPDSVAIALCAQFPQYFPGNENKYVRINPITYCTSDYEYRTADMQVVDWREIIYQMAKDYYQYNRMDILVDGVYYNFYNLVQEANRKPDGSYRYPLGRTNYEQYYSDIEGFWRELYNPEAIDTIVDKGTDRVCLESEKAGPQLGKMYYQWDNALMTYRELAFDQITHLRDPISEPANIQYYIRNNANEMKEMTNVDINNLPNRRLRADKKYYIKDNHGEYQCVNNYVFNTDNITKDGQLFYDATAPLYDNNKFHLKEYWNTIIAENPASLNFWFDFLTDNSELGQYSIPAIGDRTKAVNDSKITSIYFKETPDVLIYEKDDELKEFSDMTGFVYVKIPAEVTNLFTISAQGKSAKTAIDELLYQFSYCTNNITINCIPIYYLEPNCLIHLFDNETKINGNYLVTKLTIPLTYNGTMTISAVKAVDRII